MTKWIVGNWKMNGNLQSLQGFCRDIGSLVQKEQIQNTLVICPSFPYLTSLANHLKGTKLTIGAQDCAASINGAYTGDVSAEMLKDIGCHYVLIGHSERRQHHHESNEVLSQKMQQTLDSGLRPIFCMGESAGDYEANETQTVLKKQLKALEPFKGNHHIMIAYEPVWAIGTGKVASSEDIQKTCTFIRTILSHEYGLSSPLLYGGSVKGENAASILSLENVDGVLVGGASLNATEFWKIAKSA